MILIYSIYAIHQIFTKKSSVYAKTCINIQLSLMLEDVRHAGRSSQDNKLLSQTLRIYMEGQGAIRLCLN